MTWALTTTRGSGVLESGAITLSNADVLMVVYVLRALNYDVAYMEDVEGTRMSARLTAALRRFQEAANREQNRRLAVDGRLGSDSLNALAWYATHSPSAVARLSSDGLTPAQQSAVQTVINARRNNAWGGGAGGGGSNGGGNGGGTGGGGGNGGGGGGGGGGSNSSRTSSSSSSTQQAGMLSSTPAKLLLGVLVGGALLAAGSYAFKQYERRQVEAGAWPSDPYGTGLPMESPYDLGERGLPTEPPPVEGDALEAILRRNSKGSRGRRKP